MYEYDSKMITDYFELKDVCRKASSYFVGSFMLEMLVRRKEWENPDTKTNFIESVYKEYFSWDKKCSIARVRNYINSTIRIIESNKVEDALRYVINSENCEIDMIAAKENAKNTLTLIESGEIKY